LGNFLINYLITALVAFQPENMIMLLGAFMFFFDKSFSELLFSLSISNYHLSWFQVEPEENNIIKYAIITQSGAMKYANGRL